MKKTIVGVALCLATLLAWALPTLEQVQDEVRLGHLSNAEQMMQEVVAARPGSAKAHYVYAEVLARNGKFAEATAQARLARQADPAITFTDPAKFTAFEDLLSRQGRSAARQPSPSGERALAPAAPSTAPSSGGVPGWVWIVGLAVLGMLLWRGFSRSRAAGGAVAGGGAMSPTASGGMPPGYGPQGGAYGPYGAPGAPGYGQPGAPGYGQPGVPGARSGMLGTGLAAAGGFAAGMLADQLMHRHRDASGSGALDQLGPTGLGGELSDPAAMELESRPVDFGTGGADWGGDTGAADAGSFDTGGGSDWS